MNAPQSIEAVVLREEIDPGVVRLTLNRPRQYNAISQEVLAALQAELHAIAKDDAVRVVVIAGNGPALSGGHDLKEMMANRTEAFVGELFDACSRVMQTLQALPQPVIARVHGTATAAGCQLVAACDLAIASEQARFATSGINLGLFCATPAVPLSRNVARKHAFEMLFTGEFIDAGRAAGHRQAAPRGRGRQGAVLPPDRGAARRGIRRSEPLDHLQHARRRRRGRRRRVPREAQAELALTWINRPAPPCDNSKNRVSTGSHTRSLQPA